MTALAGICGGLALDIGDHAVDAVVVGDQFFAARLVSDLDLALLGGLEQALDQPRPAAPGFERQPAPEHELAVVLEGLARVHRRKADALAAHPQQRFLAFGDQQLGHVGIAAVIGQPAEIVIIFVGGVGAEIAGRDLGLGEVAQLQQIIDAIVDKAQCPGGVAAVAAALVKRRRLQHQHPRAFAPRRQCRAHAGIPGADDNDVELARDHIAPSASVRCRGSSARKPGVASMTRRRAGAAASRDAGPQPDCAHQQLTGRWPREYHRKERVLAGSSPRPPHLLARRRIFLERGLVGRRHRGLRRQHASRRTTGDAPCPDEFGNRRLAAPVRENSCRFRPDHRSHRSCPIRLPNWRLQGAI